MANISIDRLGLTLTGRSSVDGERLARLIAEKLAAASLSMRTSGRRETMNVEITEPQEMELDQLAGTVVADLVRQLSRTV